MASIYVHIPFCARKCDYCDFFSIPCARDAVPEAAYLQAVLGQLERDRSSFSGEGMRVDTVYFGGGTPSLLSPDFFAAVLAAIQGRLGLSSKAEISCEVNPATVEGQWFQESCAAGITRISIGVQSFQPELLAVLGRIHSADDAMRAIAEAQDAGFESVSLDLMYAIPGEAQAMLEDDMRTAMMFQPTHISAYQLTLEEGTSLFEKLKGRNSGLETRNSEKQIELPCDEEGLKQMRIVARMLSRGGWNRYEISNFAKPGSECRHNMNYWRYGEYLGLGAGATSFSSSVRQKSSDGPSVRLSDGINRRTIGLSDHRTVFARRWTQVRDVRRYMQGTGELAEEETLDARTAMAEFCFLGLRMLRGFSRAHFAEIFGEAFDERFARVVSELAAERMLVEEGDVIRLSPKGLELSNQVFERFLP